MASRTHHGHRFSSIYSVRRLKLGALLCLLCFLTALPIIPLLFATYHTRDQNLLIITLSVIGTFLLFLIWLFILSFNIRCPLCTGFFFRKRSGSSSRRRKTNRITLSLKILFRGRFSCPHCNESCLTEVRDKASERAEATLVSQRPSRRVGSLPKSREY